jgi:hypothetical protein
MGEQPKSAGFFASLGVRRTSAQRRAPAEPEDAARVAARVESLADEFLDSWVRWREACGDVRSAYDRWRRCQEAQRPLAFASYSAALDREEHAARIHSVWTGRFQDTVRGSASA